MPNLNLGCGSNKIHGYINIDVEASCNPDLVCDFTKDLLPYEDNYIEEVLLFHTIEHITKRKHNFILSEIHRVLKPKGKFIVSYPEFRRCYENWVTNLNDNRSFWEATLFGRQLYPSDYHVCIMDTVEFTQTLLNNGFHGIASQQEPDQPFNTFMVCEKGDKPISYEEVVKRDLSQFYLVGQ